MPQWDLLATTAFGLEAVVARELTQLGYEPEIIQQGCVFFRGDESAICRANLWLRCADRVLVRIAHFSAHDFDTLFETTRSLDWENWIGSDARFPVVGRSRYSRLSSVPACQRTVKKAVVERLQSVHKTETLPESGPLYRIEVALLKDQVTLTIDTTGASLHKRGYRTSSPIAPLKETLAAALVYLSFWKPERPLIDPFCGSGTVPIEAALIGRNLAPGIWRDFTSQQWPAIDRRLWENARAEARDLARGDLPQRLIGTDINRNVLKQARGNAHAAAVDGDIHFQAKPFDQLTSKREYGCVIMNPPYGERIGRHEHLRSLYRSIPEVLRRLPTWSHYILTSYPGFEKLIGQTANRRRKLYNGRIECTYYQFHGPRPAGNRSLLSLRRSIDGPSSARRPTVRRAEHGHQKPIVTKHVSTELTGESYRSPDSRPVVPAFGGLDKKACEQADIFRNRLMKRARHLRRWPTRQGISCFRIYERDIPEIPLVIDRYEDHLHITEYQRPHDRDIGQHADWLDLMVKTASDALAIDTNNVFLKRRDRQRGASQHQRLNDDGYELTVAEGGLRFLVNLSDFVDTGLFLDHRLTRDMVRAQAGGKRFLNLFCYTGAFTLYAIAGGASGTTSVDWSNTYLNWAERNMALNGFDGLEHKFVRDDVREYLSRRSSHETYDLAVVDPPTFSNSKRAENDWDVQRDHVDLLNRVLQVMSPGGTVFFSTNYRKFKMHDESIDSRDIREISRQTVPPDFRNRRIHRCWRITRT